MTILVRLSFQANLVFLLYYNLEDPREPIDTINQYLIGIKKEGMFYYN